MVKVLAVNNYPTRERFERLEKCFVENGARVTSIDWDAANATLFDTFDGVVLSGSPDMMSEPKIWNKFRDEIDAIKRSSSPILGVCFGHQMMAHTFGARVVQDGRNVLEMVNTKVLERDPIFAGLPSSMMLLESRHEVVESLPKQFRLLAESEASRIAAMKHETRPLYGVQFHPERYTRENPDGRAVVGNFIRMLG